MLTRSQAAFKIVDLEPPTPSLPLTPLSIQTLSKKPKEIKVTETKDDSDDEEEKSESRVDLGDKRPSPTKFDQFIPWACKQWRLSQVVIVNRTVQEDYIPYLARKKPKIKRRNILGDDSTSLLESKTAGLTITAKSKSAISAKSAVSTVPVKVVSVSRPILVGEPTIPLTAVYDPRGKLIEVAINNCQETIPRQLIRAISVALPFHKSLYKVTIRKSKLTQGTICEIGELLEFSNVTEVCLDDNYVRQGNYYVLLDELTSLKTLSLCRCCINDDVVADIVRRLYPDRPGDKLQSLSLSTNFITDVGACLFGNLLRSNRNLMHLNLADNWITNVGALSIMKSLKEFELNEEEIRRTKIKRMAYYNRKIKVYQKLLKEPKSIRHKSFVPKIPSATPITSHRKSKAFERREASKSLVNIRPVKSLKDVAYSMAQQIVGGFKYTFDDNNTVMKDNKLYCIGNFNFCFLNLAYNDLDERILKEIHQLLTYQANAQKPVLQTGLLRLVLEGNLFPGDNTELHLIKALLTQLLPERLQADSKLRKKGILSQSKIHP